MEGRIGTRMIQKCGRDKEKAVAERKKENRRKWAESKCRNKE